MKQTLKSYTVMYILQYYNQCLLLVQIFSNFSHFYEVKSSHKFAVVKSRIFVVPGHLQVPDFVENLMSRRHDFILLPNKFDFPLENHLRTKTSFSEISKCDHPLIPIKYTILTPSRLDKIYFWNVLLKVGTFPITESWFSPVLSPFENETRIFLAVELTKRFNVSGFYTYADSSEIHPSLTFGITALRNRSGQLFYFGRDHQTGWITPAEIVTGWNSIVNPLPWELYLLTGITLGVVSTIFWFILKFSPETKTISLQKIVELLIRPLLDESEPIPAKIENITGITVLFVTWLVLSFVLTEAYKTGLLQSLVKAELSQVPETFKNLITSDIPYFAMAGTLQKASPDNCTFTSGILTIFRDEVKFRGNSNPEFNTILQALNTCFSMEIDYSDVRKRMSERKEIFVGNRFQLNGLQKSFPHKIPISKEFLKIREYILVSNDQFQEESIILMNRFLSAGITQKYIAEENIAFENEITQDSLNLEPNLSLRNCSSDESNGFKRRNQCLVLRTGKSGPESIGVKQMTILFVVVCMSYLLCVIGISLEFYFHTI